MLKFGERLDDLHRDGFKIIQHPDKFCFGMDAVLLADFAKVHRGQRALDLCAGNGIVSILMAARSPQDAAFNGIEIQPEMVCMANRSIQYNNLQDRVNITLGDIRRGDSTPPLGTVPVFDVVTANPPYMPVGDGKQSPNEANALARHEIMCTLDDVVAAASRHLVPKGRFYMVHRPARLAEIFASLAKHDMAAKALRLVQPKINQPPNLLLISAIKGGNPGLVVDAPLIVYNKTGEYTEEVKRIYEVGL